MTPTDNSARRQEALQWLGRSADNWKAELDEFEERAADLPDRARAELGRAVDDLRTRWSEVKARVEQMQDNGDEQIDGARRWAAERYRELTALGQRLSEKLLVNGDGGARTRYILGPSPAGGWDLRRAGGAHPLRHFPDKRSALAYSSRHARDQEPSELVVRRQDGTFQQTRSYGAVRQD